MRECPSQPDSPEEPLLDDCQTNEGDILSPLHGTKSSACREGSFDSLECTLIDVLGASSNHTNA